MPVLLCRCGDPSVGRTRPDAATGHFGQAFGAPTRRPAAGDGRDPRRAVRRFLRACAAWVEDLVERRAHEREGEHDEDDRDARRHQVRPVRQAGGAELQA